MARELEPELMQRLGLLVTRWSFVEQCVSDLFISITGGIPGAMIVVTANVSQNAICSWIRTLLDIRPTDPEVANQIRDLLTEIDELRAERNALVHGIWGTEGPPMSALVQTVRLERAEIIRDIVVTASDLDDLIDRTNDVALALRAILRSIGSPAAD